MPRKIESYSHKKKERKNNSPIGLAKTDLDTDDKFAYQYPPHDPHIDPVLQWVKKTEYKSFDVPILSLHVHERIDPRTIIEAVRKRNGGNDKQRLLFDNNADIPLRQAIEFYKHDQGLMESYKGTISLPFELGKKERIAVKIVDDRGIESLIVRDVIPENTK